MVCVDLLPLLSSRFIIIVGLASDIFGRVESEVFELMFDTLKDVLGVMLVMLLGSEVLANSHSSTI